MAAIGVTWVVFILLLITMCNGRPKFDSVEEFKKSYSHDLKGCVYVIALYVHEAYVNAKRSCEENSAHLTNKKEVCRYDEDIHDQVWIYSSKDVRENQTLYRDSSIITYGGSSKISVCILHESTCPDLPWVEKRESCVGIDKNDEQSSLTFIRAPILGMTVIGVLYICSCLVRKDQQKEQIFKKMVILFCLTHAVASAHSACGKHEFECGGECLYMSKYCDGIQDCEDGWDEDKCGCRFDETVCDGGRCILYNQLCDGIQDCKDNTDEAYCGESPVLLLLSAYKLERADTFNASYDYSDNDQFYCLAPFEDKTIFNVHGLHFGYMTQKKVKVSDILRTYPHGADVSCESSPPSGRSKTSSARPRLSNKIKLRVEDIEVFPIKLSLTCGRSLRRYMITEYMGDINEELGLKDGVFKACNTETFTKYSEHFDNATKVELCEAIERHNVLKLSSNISKVNSTYYISALLRKPKQTSFHEQRNTISSRSNLHSVQKATSTLCTST